MDKYPRSGEYTYFELKLKWDFIEFQACTVGPGTVVTCARAGAEFELGLSWSLVFASILAYILQVTWKKCSNVKNTDHPSVRKNCKNGTSENMMTCILQEGTARLTIVSGRSLGQCLREKYKSAWGFMNTAWICWIVAACVWLVSLSTHDTTRTRKTLHNVRL